MGHLAHGPANRRRRVLETAAPLFVCEPSGASRGGVIVVHDMLGLTHDAEAACRHLARDGWLTVAPFLFHSRGGPTFGLSSLAAARAELGRRSPGELGADLAAAASYLAGRGCGDVAVAGFGAGGYLVVYGQASGPVPPFSIARLNIASTFITRPSIAHYTRTRKQLLDRAADVFAGLADGSLTSRVHAVYPLAEAAQAHQELESRRAIGKIILLPGQGQGQGKGR